MTGESIAALADYERSALHNFFIQVTFPILAPHGDQFCVIGTGTLFKIAGRYFLISAAHILDGYPPEKWCYPEGPHKGAIRTIGAAEFNRVKDDVIDICVVEIKDPETIAIVEKNWRVITLDNVWLPDLSADSVYLSGFPSVRAVYKDANLHGRIFLLRRSFRAEKPDMAKHSAEATRKGVDFFVDFTKPTINELTDEDVSDVAINGMSGCSVWAYRKRGWHSHKVWLPESVLCVVGVQSAYVRNDFLRCKSWGAVMTALFSLDKEIRGELAATVDKIRIALER
jgi:hypothetical protein